ncbi:uncharacterized protein LOC141673291 [Apium graveolens]|uniref:uncharacterized protein LOC141673291 n=1 Tax=Apium graveolens TaxID=4045 RepID=UPI003D794401
MGDFDFGGKSGGKRVLDEIGGDLEMGGCERFDFDGGGGGKRRFRVVGDGERLNLGSGGEEVERNEVGGVERLEFDGGGFGKRGIGVVGDEEKVGVVERSNLGSGGEDVGRNEVGGVEEGGVCGKMRIGVVGDAEKAGYGERLNLGLGGGEAGRNEVKGVEEGGVSERLNFDGGVIVGEGEKVGGCERLNPGSGFAEVVRSEIGGVEEGSGVRELGKDSESSGGLNEKELNLDLNVSVFDVEEYAGCPLGGGVGGVRGVVDEDCVEVVNISSDESGDEGVVEDFKGKGKVIEEGGGSGSNIGLDFYLGLERSGEVGQDIGGSMGGGQRYSREEKGKAKVVEPWISLGGNSMELDWISEFPNQAQPAIPNLDLGLPEIFQQQEIIEFIVLNGRRDVEFDRRREEEAREFEFRRELDARELQLRWENQARMAEEHRQREIEVRKRTSRLFARPLEEDGGIENEQKLPSNALNKHKEQKKKLNEQQLIRWKPSEDRDKKNSKRFVPSLLDLSLKVLADNADAIVSLEGVPDSLKRKLSNILCDSRKMNVKVLDLFVRGAPEEIRIKNTSWITDSQFRTSFGSFEPKNLRVFQLDLCGQCVFDDILAKTLIQSSSSLPSLGIISLRGACRLSDDALDGLVQLAPALYSLNLGENALLTHVGIHYLANALGTSLRELYIDNCSRIDARHIASALKKFEHLEVLSVAGLPNVCDRVVSDIITACGRNIKDLDLADCERLTDSSLDIIGQTCSDLRALNIVNLYNLTDMGLSYFANGCKSIRSLKLCRNKFSDEAIAAFIEIAGRSLEELSLNHVKQVGSCTALSLAKFSRKLISLDLSWCRRVTDEALGLLVDSCWSLKQLKLFGCTQITDVFLHGHSNSLVRIIGLDMTTSLIEHAGVLDAEEVYLRYSPLPIPESENLDHQDV